MQSEMSAREVEEKEEEIRHDELYRNEPIPLLKKEEWTKFDSIRQATHGYVYSIQRLGDVRGKRVLDLGCGTGWLSVILAKRGAQVEGIEISAEAVRLAREMASLNGVSERTNFTKSSAYSLNFPDEHFDMVAGQAILHHLSDKRAVAREVQRVLKKGGKAIFYECFGDSQAFERLRLFVPVKVAEDDREHWNAQFKYTDLDVFRELFEVRFREFQLLSRLDRVIKSSRVVERLGVLDVWLLRKFPALRRYARTLVVECTKT